MEKGAAYWHRGGANVIKDGRSEKQFYLGEIITHLKYIDQIILSFFVWIIITLSLSSWLNY